MRTMIEEVEELGKIYDGYLTIGEVQVRAEAAFEAVFQPKEKYSNPFYTYNPEDVMKKTRDNIIRQIEGIFGKLYPNVPLADQGFRNLGNGENLKINFKAAKEKLLALECHADELAIAFLTSEALKLVEHGRKFEGYGKKREFKPEELLRGRAIQLWTGWSYNSPRTDHNREFLRLMSVLMRGATPATAEECPYVRFRYYKNGRADAIFEDKETARKIAEFLADAWLARAELGR